MKTSDLVLYFDVKDCVKGQILEGYVQVVKTFLAFQSRL